MEKVIEIKGAVIISPPTSQWYEPKIVDRAFRWCKVKDNALLVSDDKEHWKRASEVFIDGCLFDLKGFEVISEVLKDAD